MLVLCISEKGTFIWGDPSKNKHHIHIVRLSLTLFFLHFCSDLDEILHKGGSYLLNLLFLLHYQCKNPSIIVRQHDQGPSISILLRRKSQIGSALALDNFSSCGPLIQHSCHGLLWSLHTRPRGCCEKR